MTDADDAAAMLQADSSAEKIEAFDESTTTLLLTQLGICMQRIKQLRFDHGDAYCLSWAVEELSLGVDLWADRFFNYDLGGLLLAPGKSPVIKAYQAHVEEYPTDMQRFMVFKAYNIGRLVAMCSRPENRPYICAVPGDNPVYITSFHNLFTDLFGSDYDL